MKKKILFMALILLLPFCVFAENKVSVICDKTQLVNNEEVECYIKATDLDFIVTSVTGKIKVSDNLKITNSFYDDKYWLMLDNEFSVKDINLISEDKEQKDSIIIAKFRIKAVNKDKDVGAISFVEVGLGDEDYSDRLLEVEDVKLELEYRKQHFKTLSIIILIFIVLSLFLLPIIKKNKK